MRVERLGIHDSVAAVFPPERLRAALTGGEAGEAGVDTDDAVDAEVVVVDDGIEACDAVVTLEHDPALLDVEWVHSIQAGVDRFPFEAFEREGVALTNSTGIHGPSVGQTVAGYALSFARRLHRHRDHQREVAWQRPDWDEAFTVDGERACVVGLGTLGRGIVEHLTALGMEAVGVRRSGEPVPGVEQVYTPDRLEEAVADARFVALAVPLTDETRGLVGAEELAAMRPDAYLLNVARGSVVDQDALVSTLQSGGIAGAALDVFEAEPLPDTSPLWEMDEVIVTPHCAAYDRDYYRDIAALVRENLRRIAAGEGLENRVV